MTLDRSTTARLAAACCALLLLPGCGGDDSTEVAGSPTIAPSSATSTSGSSAATSTASAPETVLTPTEAATTSSPTTAAVEIDVTIAAGQVTTADERVPVSGMETVRITVTTDESDELHVHGVDLTLDLEAGVVNVLEFEVPSDLAPGLYEVETHDSGLLLFELELS